MQPQVAGVQAQPPRVAATGFLPDVG